MLICDLDIVIANSRKGTDNFLARVERDVSSIKTRQEMLLLKVSSIYLYSASIFRPNPTVSVGYLRSISVNFARMLTDTYCQYSIVY